MMRMEQKKAILNYVESNKNEAIQILQDMVRIPSVTHPPSGDEKKVQEYIEQVFKTMNLQIDVFEPTEVQDIEKHAGYWPGLDYKDRPNVVGTLKGSGGGKTLILNGHCDVVPEGDLEMWNEHPFSGSIIGNKLYGRGTADMKGGIAAMTMAVKCLIESGITLKGDVVLESVVNEEMGGYNGTLACILRGYEGDAAIITEPTGLRIMPATKGGQAYKITVKGIGTHVCCWDEGVSALDKAIIVKKAIEEFAKIREKQTSGAPYYDNKEIYPVPAYTDCIYSFHCGETNMMSVPNEVKMDLMIESVPGESIADVKTAFETYLLDATQEDEFLKKNPLIFEVPDMRPFDGTMINEDEPIIAELKDAYREVMLQEALICGFESVCDSMMFNLYSETPALLFGPGELKMAHRPNEYIDLEQYIQSIKILAILIADYCEIDEKN